MHGLAPSDPGFAEAYAQMQSDSSVYDIAGMFGLQSVIQPEETRGALVRLLETHQLRPTKGVGAHLMRAWPTSY